MCFDEQEAARTNAVVLISDTKFLPSAFFITSKLVDQPDRNFDVVILLVGARAKDCKSPDPRVIVRDFTINPQLVRFAAEHRRPLVTFGKIGLGALAGDYDKILYLDSDVWIAGGSIAELLKIDMGGYAIAAVRDSAEVVRGQSPQWREYKTRLGLGAAVPYFNAGVLLIDLARFVRRGIADNTMRYILDGNYLGPMNDQSGFNAVIRGDWLELSPLWNWMFATRDALTEEARPNIIHFTGRIKPWNDTKGRYPPRYALAMHTYLRTSDYRDFVKFPGLWPAYRWRMVNALRNLSNGHLEDRRTRAIRTYLMEQKFSLLGVAERPRPWHHAHNNLAATSMFSAFYASTVAGDQGSMPHRARPDR